MRDRLPDLARHHPPGRRRLGGLRRGRRPRARSARARGHPRLRPPPGLGARARSATAYGCARVGRAAHRLPARPGLAPAPPARRGRGRRRRQRAAVRLAAGAPPGRGRAGPPRARRAVAHHLPGLAGRVGWFVESRVVPLLYRGRAVLTVSEASARDLVGDRHRPGRRITVVRNGLAARAAARSDAERRRPRLVVLARLVPHKQIEHAFEVVPRLATSSPTCASTSSARAGGTTSWSRRRADLGVDRPGHLPRPRQRRPARRARRPGLG